MLSWMSIEANFNLYVGRATANLKGVVAGKKLKKENAYPMLAAHVNQMCSSNWTAKDAKSRWRSFHNCYKDTKV